MEAKGHIVTGVLTSATIASILSNTDDALTLITHVSLCVFGSLLTSQIADLDSVTSGISHIFPLLRILTNNIVLVLEICGICLFINALLLAGHNTAIMYYKYLAGLILFFCMQIWLRKNLHHRGFTHTLLFNILLSCLIIFPYFWYDKNIYYSFFAAGGISGLFSHLIFDTITVQGCPLLSPFYKKNIKWLKRLKLKSGKDDIYGIMLCLIVFVSVVFTKARYLR